MGTHVCITRVVPATGSEKMVSNFQTVFSHHLYLIPAIPACRVLSEEKFPS